MKFGANSNMRQYDNVTYAVPKLTRNCACLLSAAKRIMNKSKNVEISQCSKLTRNSASLCGRLQMIWSKHCTPADCQKSFKSQDSTEQQMKQSRVEQNGDQGHKSKAMHQNKQPVKKEWERLILGLPKCKVELGMYKGWVQELMNGSSP